VANRGIVSEREKNGIAQSDRRSPVSVGTMASGTVLSVQDIELHNLAWRDDLGVW